MTLPPLLLTLPTETLDEIVSFYKNDIKGLIQISGTSKLCNSLAARYLYANAPLTRASRLASFVHLMSRGPQPHRHLQCIQKLTVNFLPIRAPSDAELATLGGMIAQMINLRELALYRPRIMPTLIPHLRTVHFPGLRSLTTDFCPASAPHIGPFIALHPALESLTLKLDIYYSGFNPEAAPPPLVPQPYLPALKDYAGAAHLIPFFHTRSLRIKHLHWYGPTDDVLAIMATAAALAPDKRTLSMNTNYVDAEQLIACTIAVYPDMHDLSIHESDRRIDMKRGLQLAKCLWAAKHLQLLTIGLPRMGYRGLTQPVSRSPEEHEEDNSIVSLWNDIRSLRGVRFNGIQWFRENHDSSRPFVRYVSQIN
ncbi:hypothetical protein B0H16DRAFT_1749730 [Mycena metata]|uniref:Uncharacterized protein n=1 Tax=Mycena metata TaxID=1033252 RepID=A0AAD7DSY7_9AGAR|nr:hypothetical protein B0H16DRAFT_1749730 [Mycena metata]